ncbi:SEL1-like repeat protein [Paraburkholderia kururiensis]|uniref:SEL1-like repeat protein n=1 Tax=Paraburkholderia kururiensis TaxID=984307 RepID=UPI0005A88CEA|nr:SEL1-like repeat protein [Paraburkholderia kururiensis]
MQILASADTGLAAPEERAWWQWKLAGRGVAKYESLLGDAYDLGDGVPADFSAATYRFRRAAEQGDVSAESSFTISS